MGSWMVGMSDMGAEGEDEVCWKWGGHNQCEMSLVELVFPTSIGSSFSSVLRSLFSYTK